MVNRWRNSGNSAWLYFWGLQNHCRWWLQPWKRRFPWKESYHQSRQHIKKQRHYFVNKGPSSQGYGFSSSRVWTWELDYKESECRRIDAFELWCWRSNQSMLKEISPGCPLGGLMLKLKLQYFGHVMPHLKRSWRWERLKAGREGDDRGWDG